MADQELIHMPRLIFPEEFSQNLFIILFCKVADREIHEDWKKHSHHCRGNKFTIGHFLHIRTQLL